MRHDMPVTLWRCRSCGKWSDALRKPAHHQRLVNGKKNKCGPFETWQAERAGGRVRITHSSRAAEFDATDNALKRMDTLIAEINASRAETIKEVVVALRERANPGIYDWAWPAADFIEREFRTRRIA